MGNAATVDAKAKAIMGAFVHHCDGLATAHRHHYLTPFTRCNILVPVHCCDTLVPFD